jgi:hypothetical protein
LQSNSGHVVVLVVDGWGAGFLGPYGNTWLETPVCNQLAAEGLLLEHVLVDSPTLAGFYQAVWQGAHAVWSPSGRLRGLAERIAERGQASCLITDEREVLEHPAAAGFSRAEWVSPGTVTAAADAVDQTQLARLLATAAATLEEDPPTLCWIHSRGMCAPWDAPRELREQFRDEDDPPLNEAVNPPTGSVGANTDPDVVQGWIWAYAGQVALLDELLDGLVSTWRRLPQPGLLIVMGARGYALAEHDVWGTEPQSLYSEHLQVPLLVISSTGELAGVRSQQLVQPWHLHATLREWLALVDDPPADSAPQASSPQTLLAHDLSDPRSAWPQLATARLDRLWAMRTPVWHACTQDHGGRPTDVRLRLFLKPDDRWEVNDVADRCPEIVDRFLALRAELEAGSTLAAAIAPLLLEPTG